MIGSATPPGRYVQIYAHRSTGRDRAATELIGQLIEEAISASEGTTPEAG